MNDQAARDVLPQRIGLCPVCCAPSAFEDFYYPLADGEGLQCPYCPEEMVVYSRTASEEEALRAALRRIEQVSIVAGEPEIAYANIARQALGEEMVRRDC